jgi:GTP-binding protein HflX
MKKKLHTTSKRAERAVLAAILTDNQTEDLVNEYLDELAFLARTAGAVTMSRFIQRMEKPNPKTFMGSGKLNEIKAYMKRREADMIIFDDELTPSQQSALEKLLEVKVIDRTGLILDIFARRAQTSQARAQVELAQLQYTLPRLKGLWTHLERQKGGIGLRGPGEREIETDRRVINKKIAQLRHKLATIDKQNYTQRKSRGEFVRVALVGYTNAGKSTLMNLLSKSKVFSENKLFATLDTTVRKVVYTNIPFLLSDTVGFIRKLPHNLVESFKSTLDETLEADIHLHVVDSSHPHYEDQINVVNETLMELKAHDKPTVLVFNKMDLYAEQHFDKLLPEKVKEDLLAELKKRWLNVSGGHAVFISATEKENIGELRELLIQMVSEIHYQRYPNNTAGLPPTES